MYENIGPVERTLRVLLGASIVAAGMSRDPVAWWAWLGLAAVVTGMVGYCPLHHLREWARRRRAGYHGPRRVV